MSDFVLLHPYSKICLEDIHSLENKLEFKLPQSFVDLYLHYNGGVPEKSWVVTNDGYDPMQIADFKFISKEVDSADTEDILGCYQFMLMRDVIPHTLLPFAVDDGGNFFCLDMLNGTVQFYATDAFRPDRSSAANHLAAQKILASSFSMFLDNLELESGLDE